MPLQLDTYGTLSAYRKIRCIATQNVPFDMKKAVADIIINGVTEATLTVDLVEVGINQFRAEIDAQSIIQDYLSPNQTQNITTSSFGVNGSPYKIVNTGLVCSIDFSVTYLEQLANGKLQDFGLVETIGQYLVFTATTQNFDSIDLAPFLPNLGVDTRFLTNSPTTQDICLDDSYYLSILSGTGFATNFVAQVQTFDSSGAVIETGEVSYVALLAAAGFTVAPITFGAGPANLRTTVYDVGAVNIDNPLIAHYTVSFGTGGGSITSEVFRFDLVPCCDSYKVRLFFLNNKSGFDAVTMQYTEQTITTKSTTIQKPLRWGDVAPYHDPLDKGRYNVNIEAIESFSLSKIVKSKAEGVRLQELAYSPEVYAEIDGQVQAVTVENGEFLSDLKDDLGIYEVKISPSNSIITMRN